MFSAELIAFLASLFDSVGLHQCDQVGKTELVFSSELGNKVTVGIRYGLVGFSAEAVPGTPDVTEKWLWKQGSRAAKIAEEAIRFGRM